MRFGSMPNLIMIGLTSFLTSCDQSSPQAMPHLPTPPVPRSEPFASALPGPKATEPTDVTPGYASNENGGFPKMIPLPMPTTAQIESASKDSPVLLCRVVEELVGQQTHYILQLEVKNTSNQEWELDDWGAIEDFPVWVLQGGQQAERTAFGKNHRWATFEGAEPLRQRGGSRRPKFIGVHESKEFRLDLSNIFVINAAASYQVIAEVALFNDMGSEFKKLIGSARFQK